jgi:biotin transport system substrate-specific component
MKTQNAVLIKNIFITLAFASGLIIASNITIPFFPVPFTLQTLMLLIAIFYDVKIAFKSTLLYIFLGCIGLPVFANFENAYLIALHPYAGYLIGFIAGVALACYLEPKNLLNKILLFYAGLFGIGVPYLAFFVGLHEAIVGGFVFFILPETLKSILAYTIYRYIR